MPAVLQECHSSPVAAPPPPVDSHPGPFTSVVRGLQKRGARQVSHTHVPLASHTRGTLHITHRLRDYTYWPGPEIRPARRPEGKGSRAEPLTVGVWLGRVDHAVEQAPVSALLQVAHLQGSRPERHAE